MLSLIVIKIDLTLVVQNGAKLPLGVDISTILPQGVTLNQNIPQILITT